MRRFAVVIACVALGCDPLASGDYVGEPLFTLEGTFAATTPDAQVGGLALVWQDSASAAGPGIAVTAVPVSLELAKFRVPVPVPPPDVARFQLDDGVQLAEAYVFAVADPNAPRPDVRGLDRTHVLIWASVDVAAGSLSADYLGEPVTAGYHLRRFAATDMVGAAQTALIDRCVGNGEPAAACRSRRAYQLGGASDRELLKVTVTP